MMLVYATVSVKEARDYLANGFGEWCSYDGQPAVLVELKPTDGPEGHEGEVILVTEIPVEVFNEYEVVGPAPGGTYDDRSGYSFVPPDVLNRYGRPRVYGHLQVGSSRRELVGLIQDLANAGRKEHAAQMREVLAFYDELGWQTLLKVKEQQHG
jgi:hypothetical protein